MIKYSNTTVFNVDTQTMVNTVNCVGIMGAGLALECQLRFPEMCDDYVKRCKQKTVQVGRPYVYRGYESSWIMNFPTKNHWKYPSRIEWIEQGLDYFVKNYERGGIQSIAFPKLGCDKGGLNWDEVKVVMEKYLRNLSIDVYICLDQESEASGVERIMIDLLNQKQDSFWISALGIRDDIATKIIASLPIKRFRELIRIPGVGKQTYNDIFKLLYSIAITPDSKSDHDTDILEAYQHSCEKCEPVQVVDKQPVLDSLVNSECIRTESLISESGVKGKQKLSTIKRNRLILLLKEAIGLEVTELCDLKWNEFKNYGDNGQVMVFGKVIPESVWQEIQSLRRNVGLDASVFHSHKGGQLSPSSVKKILLNAAKKVETDGKVPEQATLKSKETQLELNLVY